MQDVGKLAAPAVAAIVGVQSVANGLIGGLLHLDVQRGVDAQAAFVDGFGAVGGFEILANVLEEIRRQIVARILDVQAQGSFLGGGFLDGRDFSLFHHLMENQIAAGERARRIDERRIDGAANHSGEQRGFLQIQVGDRFAEIKLRRRRQNRNCRGPGTPGWRTW